MEARAVSPGNEGEGRAPSPRMVEAPLMESLIRHCEELPPSETTGNQDQPVTVNDDGQVFASYVQVSDGYIISSGQGESWPIPDYVPPGQFMIQTMGPNHARPVYTSPVIPTEMTYTGSQNSTWLSSTASNIYLGQITNATTTSATTQSFQQEGTPVFGNIPCFNFMQPHTLPIYQAPFLPSDGTHAVSLPTPGIMGVAVQLPSVPPTATSGGIALNPAQMQLSGHPQLEAGQDDPGRKFIRLIRNSLGRYSRNFIRFVDLMMEYRSEVVSLDAVVKESVRLFGGDPFLVGEFKEFLPAPYHDMDLTLESVSSNNGEVASVPAASPSLVTDDDRANVEAIVSQPNVVVDEGHQETSSVQIEANTESNEVITIDENVSEECVEIPAASSASICSIEEPSTTSPYDELFAKTNQDSFVNRVKERFNAKMYAEFIDIVLDYKAKMTTSRETGTPISLVYEAKTLTTIQILFRDYQDLLKEFYNYLPFVDAKTGEIIPSSYCLPTKSVDESMDRFLADSIDSLNKKRTDQETATLKEQFKLETRKFALSRLRPRPNTDESLKTVKFLHAPENVNLLETRVQPGPSGCDSPALKMLNLANAIKSNENVDKAAMCRNIKQKLKSSSEQYRQLSCSMDLYDMEVISGSEMIHIGEDILGKYPKLSEKLRTYIVQVERLKKEGNYYALEVLRRGASPEDEDILKRRRVGASYYYDTDQVSAKPSAPLRGIQRELNNVWVSSPIWSENFKIHPKKKSQTESNLDKVEDYLFLLDRKINILRSTIVCLEVAKKQMQGMKRKELSKFKLDDNLGGTTILHPELIKSFYGQHGQEIIEHLKRAPKKAIPVVLNRLNNCLTDTLYEKLNYDKTLWRKYKNFGPAVIRSHEQQKMICEIAAKNESSLDKLVSENSRLSEKES